MKENDSRKKLKSKRIRNAIYSICLIILIMILLSNIWSKIQEEAFFHPWNDEDAYKQLQQIEEFTEINIQTKDLKLSGWFWNIQKSNKREPLIIYFQGNANNSSNTLYNYYKSDKMRKVYENYNLLVIDYPGYEKSQGKPSDNSMFLASETIYKYATKMKEVDKNNIVIMGYSIGTGVASYCASKYNTNGLILVAPYDNALSLYNDKINIFHSIFKYLTKYKFSSDVYAESVEEPTLIFTSKEDEIINYKHSIDLSNHFTSLEEIIILEDVNHSSYFLQEEVLTKIQEFINNKRSKKE